MHPIERILLATDFSEAAQPAFTYARMLAEKLGARIHVLYVSEVPDVLIGDAVALGERFTDADIVAGRAQVDRLVRELRANGLEADGEVGVGFLPDAIIERAVPDKFDLLVLGTHGRTGVHRLTAGSVAELAVRKVGIPVLTIRSTPQP